MLFIASAPAEGGWGPCTTDSHGVDTTAGSQLVALCQVSLLMHRTLQLPYTQTQHGYTQYGRLVTVCTTHNNKVGTPPGTNSATKHTFAAAHGPSSPVFSACCSASAWPDAKVVSYNSLACCIIIRSRQAALRWHSCCSCCHTSGGESCSKTHMQQGRPRAGETALPCCAFAHCTDSSI